jgi:hypothetical protein
MTCLCEYRKDREVLFLNRLTSGGNNLTKEIALAIALM